MAAEVDFADVLEDSCRAFDIAEVPERGRFLVAARHLLPGDDVLSCEPYAWVVTDAQRRRMCAKCMCTVRELQLCIRCHQIAFCVDTCASGDTSHSAVECKALCRLAGIVHAVGRTDYIRLILRVLLRAFYESRVGTGLPSFLNRLCPTVESAQKNASCEVRSEAEHVHKILPHSVRQRFTLEEILGLACKIHENNFGIWLQKGEPLGCGLFLGAASLLNSSCVPTCARAEPWQAPFLRIKVIREVYQGDELTISYFGPGLQQSLDYRRQYLLDQWGFTCQCDRCTNETKWRGVVETLVCSCGGWIAATACLSCGQTKQTKR